jgi:hypothetical protein
MIDFGEGSMGCWEECTLQKLDEIFYRHQLGPVDLWCDLVLRFLYWFFCLDDLSIGDSGVLRSPTTTVFEFIYVFMSFRADTLS